MAGAIERDAIEHESLRPRRIRKAHRLECDLAARGRRQRERLCRRLDRRLDAKQLGEPLRVVQHQREPLVGRDPAGEADRQDVLVQDAVDPDQLGVGGAALPPGGPQPLPGLLHPRAQRVAELRRHALLGVAAHVEQQPADQEIRGVRTKGRLERRDLLLEGRRKRRPPLAAIRSRARWRGCGEPGCRRRSGAAGSTGPWCAPAWPRHRAGVRRSPWFMPSRRPPRCCSGSASGPTGSSRCSHSAGRWQRTAAE